jgi:hypothetical protein
MAYESVVRISVMVRSVAGLALALPNRFCRFDNAETERRGVITHVPGALGACAQGILAMKADSKNVPNGYSQSSMIIPNGAIAEVELGEAVTNLNVPLRIGGNGGEIDGAAYLANAAGDIIVGWPIQVGAVGEVIPFQFIPYGGVVA